MAKKRVTLAQVARAAGVSQTAASYALAGRAAEMRISPEVEARVRLVAREAGYRPNAVSRSLRTGTSQTIGFVSDTVATTAFAGHLIWGALDQARERDHLLLIAETEGDPQLERELMTAMLDRGVDGLIVASMYTRAIAVPPVLMEAPAVLLNAVPVGNELIRSVVPDEIEAGRSVARTLLAAGHADGICLIGASPDGEVPKGSLAAVQRLEGILSVLRDAGVEVAGSVGCTDWQPAEGLEATQRLLAELVPSALICFNDRLAFGAYQALADAGLDVPDDVSVISFDDDPLASWIRPRLTTVALPHYELGAAAVQLLMGQLEGQPPEPADALAKKITMPLRVRESVRGLGGDGVPGVSADSIGTFGASRVREGR
ncbi:MAG: LacI family DNA-binding transcriptional regulator [Solirubrobacteraceae bacterium]